eukprot:Rmarinus@m.29955
MKEAKRRRTGSLNSSSPSVDSAVGPLSESNIVDLLNKELARKREEREKEREREREEREREREVNARLVKILENQLGDSNDRAERALDEVTRLRAHFESEVTKLRSQLSASNLQAVVARSKSASYICMRSGGMLHVDRCLVSNQRPMNDRVDDAKQKLRVDDRMSEKDFMPVAVDALTALFPYVEVRDTTQQGWMENHYPDIALVQPGAERVNPLTVAAIVEIKAPGSALTPDFKSQTIQYGIRLMELDRRRIFVYCLLWNGKQLFIFKVQRNQDDLEVKESPDLDGKIFVNCPLCQFAAFRLYELGFVELPAIRGNYKLENYVASGYTSTVYEVTSPANERGVLKVTQNVVDARHEAEVLRVLTDIGRVPKLVETCEDDMLYMIPCGMPSTHVSLDIFRSLVRTLEAVHKKGWCHRDLRLPNILTYGGEPLLIDWGFAAKIGVSTDFRGGIQTAPDRVLMIMREGETSYEPTASDDLVSIVRCTILANHSWLVEPPTVYNAVRDAINFLNFWAEKRTLFRNLYKPAENSDYTALCEAAAEYLC